MGDAALVAASLLFSLPPPLHVPSCSYQQMPSSPESGCLGTGSAPRRAARLRQPGADPEAAAEGAGLLFSSVEVHRQLSSEELKMDRTDQLSLAETLCSDPLLSAQDK